MQFVWIGFLKSTEPIEQSVQQQITQFLQQPYLPIKAAGPMCDGEGNRAGYMVVFDADNRETAEAFVADSPLRRAGLYREFHLLEYRDEIG